MKGPQELAEALSAFITGNIDAEVDRLAVELGAVVNDPFRGQEVELDARVRLVAATDIPAQDVGFDDWPFVVVTVARMSRQRRVGVLGDASAVYTRTYPVRIYVWARGDGFHYTAAVRARSLLAVGELLLRNQRFGTTTGRISEDDWTEEYSGVGEDAELKSTVAAAYIETSVDVDETVAPARAPKGVATTIRLDTRALPDHPAL